MRRFLILGLWVLGVAVSPWVGAQTQGPHDEPPSTATLANIKADIGANIQVTSPHFTLSGDIKSDAAIDMIAELERFRAALLELHEIPKDTPDKVVDIYVISDPEIFQILNLSSEFIAIYSKSMVGPRALVNGNVLKENPDVLRNSLRHEYVHHFNDVYRTMSMPRWLDEGLAEYYAGFAELPDGRFQFGKPERLAQFILTYPLEGWVPLDTVLLSMAEINTRSRNRKIPPNWQGPHPSANSLFYAQSWAIAHYMLNQPNGRAHLEALVDELVHIMGEGAGNTPQTQDVYTAQKSRNQDAVGQAISIAFTESETEFPATLQTYATSDNLPLLTFTPQSPYEAPAISVRNLSESEAAAVQYRLMSMIAPQATINAKMKEMRTLIETNPDLALSLLVSDAAQKYVLGANVAALEKIRDALSRDPHIKNGKRLAANIQFQELTNQYYLKGEDMRLALRDLLRAHPNDPLFLVMMAMTGYREANNMPPEAAVALTKIEQLEIIKTHPVTTLPLIDLYVEQEAYEKALALGHRAIPFMTGYDGNSFSVRQVMDNIRRELDRQNKGEDGALD